MLSRQSLLTLVSEKKHRRYRTGISFIISLSISINFFTLCDPTSYEPVKLKRSCVKEIFEFIFTKESRLVYYTLNSLRLNNISQLNIPIRQVKEVITFPLSRDNPLPILKNCRVFYISFVMFHTLMLSTLIAVCNILWEFVFNVNTLSDSRRVSTWRGFLNIGEYQVEEHRIFTLRAAVHFRTCQTSRFLLSIFSSYTFLSFTLASFTSTCLFVNLFSGLLTEIKFSWDWF